MGNIQIAADLYNISTRWQFEQALEDKTVEVI